MMLTQNQKQAINIIDQNLLVNAGAGSGKTKVLVDRYINILENGNLEKYKEIEGIVAITFTKKAQSEMKERIRKKIIEKSKLNLEWNRIYEDLEMANISTIHAFCSNILNENPIEAKVIPGFGILEEYEKSKFIDEILKEILIKKIENDDKVYKFLEYFTPFSMEESTYKENIIDTIKKIYFNIRTTGKDISDVEDITINNIDNLKCNFSNLDYIKEKVTYLIENCTKKSKINKLKDSDIWIDFYNDDDKEIKKEDLFKLLYIKQNLGRNKKIQETIDEVTKEIDHALKLLEKMNKDTYISIFHILRLLDEKYIEKKEKACKLDYEDLQILTLKLFNNNEILNHYRDKFKYIMIDEFQDTDNLQKEILYKLCSKEKPLDRNNLFVVGDPKQSIYRFRGADISVFDEVKKDILKENDKLVLSLDDNFRTKDTIMKVINNFFLKLMKEKYQILHPNKISKSKVDVEILKNDDLNIPQSQDKGEYSKKYEASLIAKRIKSLVNDKEYNYNDFAMIFRSMTDVSLYEEELKKYNIPFSTISGNGLLYSQEIIDIINALKLINNKEDLLALVGYLRSPMLGASDQETYDYIENGKESETIKLGYEIIDQLSNLKGIIRLDELLIELVNLTNFVEISLLLYDNIQKKSNVERFISYTKEIVMDEHMDLNEFLNHIEDLKKYGQDIEKENVGLEKDSVNILTIHKSKGLEFKVVIIPQISKPFPSKTHDFLYVKDKGMGIKYLDQNNKACKELSFIYSNLMDIEKKENLEENKRILYVAMTRAEEKLILGCQAAASNYKNSFKTMLEENLDSPNIKYIDNIDLSYEEDEGIKILNENHLNKKNINNNVFPLIDSYNNSIKKKFESLSISSYMKYKDCKRSFYYEYYEKTPLFNNNNAISKGKVLASAQKGIIIHRICELYNSHIDKEKIIKKVLKENNINSSKEIIEEITPYLDNYIRMKDFYDKKEYNEIPFLYNISDIKLSGIIDKIIIDEDGGEIIDLKTNAVKNKEYIINKYSTQMQLYASIVKDLYGVHIKGAKLMMLKTGEYLHIDISNEALKENMTNIKEFINFVNLHSEKIDYKKDISKCNYCNYKKICK